jgi:hypothetical protein
MTGRAKHAIERQRDQACKPKIGHRRLTVRRSTVSLYRAQWLPDCIALPGFDLASRSLILASRLFQLVLGFILWCRLFSLEVKLENSAPVRLRNSDQVAFDTDLLSLPRQMPE